MMAIKVKTSKDFGLAKLAARFDCGKLSLVAGVLKGSTNGEEGSKTPVAQYAYYNEYGTQTMPARPFMRTAVKAYGDEWIEAIAGYMQAGCSPKEALQNCKNLVRGDIINSIRNGSYKSLAPSTVRQKKRKGTAEPSTPLIDTGALIRSINSEVRES